MIINAQKPENKARGASRLSGMAKVSSDNKMSDQQIQKVAEDFEAMFLNDVLKNMFEGIKTNGLFGGGHGEDQYKSLLTEEYAKVIAKSGGVGIADHVKKEMIRLQEVAA